MPQDQVLVHSSQERRVRKSHQEPIMETVQQIHLVEDDEDDLEEEEQTDEYDEDEDDVDESVAEDMKKLEESFKGISQKYRLINRIGEGQSTNTNMGFSKTDPIRYFLDSLQSRAVSSRR